MLLHVAHYWCIAQGCSFLFAQKVPGVRNETDTPELGASGPSREHRSLPRLALSPVSGSPEWQYGSGRGLRGDRRGTQWLEEIPGTGIARQRLSKLPQGAPPRQVASSQHCSYAPPQASHTPRAELLVVHIRPTSPQKAPPQQGSPAAPQPACKHRVLPDSSPSWHDHLQCEHHGGFIGADLQIHRD